MTITEHKLPPILANKNYSEPSHFVADNLLREARRQRKIAAGRIPSVCVLDPDGDILRNLLATGRAELVPHWACYHTDLYQFDHGGTTFGIVGCAVGASFAVLIAEEMFVSGCELLISVTSSGQIVAAQEPPYFVLIERALRDEGTSYHYLPPSDYAYLSPDLMARTKNALDALAEPIVRGPAWTTDAPFRETTSAIKHARSEGILAVEMEAAALYAFAQAKAKKVICFAHVTNQMGAIEGDFEKGEADGSRDALALIAATARALSLPTRAQLLESWMREEQQPFEGWDFSYLSGRMIEEKISWSYEDRAIALMQRAESLLDMDTGGGERLLDCREHWPARVAVTEGYPPNIKVATERLAPLGVAVAAADLDHDPLPFADDQFELIINRHGALPVGEVARVLTPNGVFLTKQVHGMWAWDLLAAFGVEEAYEEAAYEDATPEYYVPKLEAAGLAVVDVQDWRGTMRFTDVGAIVYYLKAIPWMAPGFSVETHKEYLFALQEQVDAGQVLEYEIGTYMIEARNHAASRRRI